MNAAARQINQVNFFQGRLFNIRFSAFTLIQFVLLTAVLLSAFSVVYTTNQYRAVHGRLQHVEQHAHTMQLQWGQLLLEQASLSRQERIQRIAIERLGMHSPKNHEVFHGF